MPTGSILGHFSYIPTRTMTQQPCAICYSGCVAVSEVNLLIPALAQAVVSRPWPLFRVTDRSSRRTAAKLLLFTRLEEQLYMERPHLARVLGRIGRVHANDSLLACLSVQALITHQRVTFERM